MSTPFVAVTARDPVPQPNDPKAGGPHVLAFAVPAEQAEDLDALGTC
jgi:hypothetical protein